MKVRKGLVAVAAATLTVVSAAYAADQVPTVAVSSVPLTAPKYMDEAPAKPLLADTLDKVPGVGSTLDSDGINVHGYVEGGYFYDTSSPLISGGPTFIAFPGAYSNRLLLDQANIQIERNVDAAAAAKAQKFDIGFKIDGGYGTDYAQVHSFGIADHELPEHASGTFPFNGSSSSTGTGPQNQYDLTQLYVVMALPMGNGLSVTAGKFVTPVGNEVINPTGNALYTHSYIFALGEPLTHTGVLGNYVINDQWSAYGGFSRGWNASSNDNNGAIDVLAGATYTPNDKWKFVFNMTEGPEQAGDCSNYWTLLDVVASWKYSDQLTFTGEGLYVDAPHFFNPAGKFSTGLSDSSAQWYGIALYGSYVLNTYATINARAEWYRDNDGATTGVDASYYEATLGVAVTPLPDNKYLKTLVIRPEARYDYASKAAYANNNPEFSEFTVAVDAILSY